MWKRIGYGTFGEYKAFISVAHSDEVQDGNNQLSRSVSITVEK